jgi:hypothetical protein
MSARFAGVGGDEAKPFAANSPAALVELMNVRRFMITV